MHSSRATRGFDQRGRRNRQLDLHIHHVGFVVSEIKTVIEGFVRSLDATWEGKVFQDPLQKVRVTFLRTACSSDPQIELVEPSAEDSPVRQFLQKGGGLHHLCYEVQDLDAHLGEMRTRGGIIVKPPLPAVAFGNRRIAWVFTQQKLLLEFLEQEKAEVPLG
jgi:methylmalonyl-CoA/ethylmalonyl-CoA epimerase